MYWVVFFSSFLSTNFIACFRHHSAVDYEWFIIFFMQCILYVKQICKKMPWNWPYFIQLMKFDPNRRNGIRLVKQIFRSSRFQWRLINRFQFFTLQSHQIVQTKRKEGEKNAHSYSNECRKLMDLATYQHFKLYYFKTRFCLLIELSCSKWLCTFADVTRQLISVNCKNGFIFWISFKFSN